MRVCDLLALFTIVTVVRTSSLKLLNYNDPIPTGGSIIPIQPFSDREPQYVHVDNEQINEILVPTDQLPSHIREKEQQSWLVVSICAYSLLNGTYYSVNYVRKRAIRQRIFVDLNAQQLQLVTAQMTELRFDAISICAARIHGHEQKFAAVWHRTYSFLFHFIIQVDTLNSCIKSDAKNARENYYAKVFEVGFSQHCSRCIRLLNFNSI
uniref:Secreted protein n=1 Tax=Ascaris lumbricoides TaxID=6252 RepID=A0A0M3IN85_ASCLU